MMPGGPYMQVVLLGLKAALQDGHLPAANTAAPSDPQASPSHDSPLPVHPSQQPSPTAALLATLECWMLLLKSLRRLLALGFEPDARTRQPVPTVRDKLPMLVHVLQQVHSFPLGGLCLRHTTSHPC